MIDDDMDDEDDVNGCDLFCDDDTYSNKAKSMMNGQKLVPTSRENKNTYIGCAGEMEEDKI